MNTEDKTPWATAASNAISKAVKQVEKDKKQGVIRLMSGIDHKGRSTEEEFSSFDELRNRLEEIGEDTWHSRVPSAMFVPDVDGFVESALEDIGAEEFFNKTNHG